MPFFENPSDFFIGGILKSDLEFVASVLRGAKSAGYERVVEPCAGQFPISRVAAKIGFDQIEASDVTIFSGILGRYAEGSGIEDMGIVTKRDGEFLTDPLDVLFLLKRAQLMENAGNAYGENMLIDYDSREEEIKATLKAQLDAMRSELPSLKYFDADMFDHIRDVMHDPKTVVVCNAPGYKGGYEKYYKPLSDAVMWNEPSYQMFDARDGYEVLMNYVDNAECLFILVEDAEAGKPTRRALYARPAGRIGYNAYVVSNKPDEVERLAGLSVVRREGTIDPIGHPIAKEGYEPSQISVMPMNARQMSYYRQLVGHSNSGTRGYGVLGDGYLMGAFGYMPLDGRNVRLSFACGNVDLCLMVAGSPSTMRMEFDDLSMSRVKTFEGMRIDGV